MTERSRLLVAAARSAAGIVDHAAVRRAGDPSAPGLVDAAAHHGLAPALHLALRDDGRVPDDAAEALAGAYHRSVRRHVLALDALGVLAEAWDGSIEWLAFKGPVLAERLYPRRDLRQYVDLDVLVRPRQLEGALQMLEDAGAILVDRNWRRLVAEQPGELRLELSTGALIDLHWHVLSRPALRDAFDLSPDELIDRSVAVELAGCVARTFDPVITVLHLALHACLAGGDRLIWAVDLHHAIRSLPDADELVRLARRSRTALPVATLLHRTRRTLGTAVDDDLLLELGGKSVWARAMSAFDALAPLERAAGGRSARRLLTRSTRHGTASSARQLQHRAASFATHTVRTRAPSPSIRLDEGGDHARCRYLSEVVGSDGGCSDHGGLAIDEAQQRARRRARVPDVERPAPD